MKKVLYLFALSALIYSCGKKEVSATYTPRVLTVTEKFNESTEGPDTALKVIKYSSDEKDASSKDLVSVTFRDTIVNIKLGETDSSATGKFASANFINTQKTALLVQVADQSGKAPYFIVALKEGKLDVVSLYRPSNGKMDLEFTKGAIPVGRNGYVVNNDFFVANVTAKVYVLKRQKPEERIQGEFIANSPDRTTLAFLTSQTSSLYQVNYVANQSLDLPISKEVSSDVYRYVQKNFSWQPTNGGIYFFKPDKVVDISAFK